MSLFSDFLNLFFPPLCLGCHQRLVSEEKFLCLSCLDSLPKTQYHNIKDNKLEELFAGRFPFVRMASFAHFSKDGVVQKVIHELKYKNNPQLGIFMGELCGNELVSSKFIHNIDYLIPVPLHPNREKQRGYNQSLQIAKGISEQTAVPVLSDYLIRVIDNPSQTKQQSKYERWSNTEGIFEIKEKDFLKEKHVLLIDDIITTGATVESCAKMLMKRNKDLSLSVYSFGSASN